MVATQFIGHRWRSSVRASVVVNWPLDLALVGVGGVLPGGQFGVEGVEVGDAAIEALAGQGGELDLGDVEPGPVSGVWWISSRCASAKALAGWNGS